ncbi:MAG: NAD-dependent epimerase/dehydratase family protein [Deltaproteobacteria bacterium]|nr:NAD-dependent epimerase/dehydratase family protein [Deltaproteobacteria bacterium]
MKILVTGGAGFIGSHVAEAYLAAGHQVVILDDLSSGHRDNVPAGARLVVMDITQPGVHELLAEERFEVINHHAAQVSVPSSVADPLADARANLLGLVNLLHGGKEFGIRRFIFISSGGAVYGEMAQPPVDENQPTHPASPYAVSKRSGEYYVDYFGGFFADGAVTLRYANVYGPRQVPHGEAGVVAIFMDQLVTGQEPTIFTYPDMPRGMVRDYVYAGDCARANLLALTQGTGAYNIGTTVATETLTLWEKARDTAGAQLGHSFGPARPGDIKRSVLRAERARQELGWEPEFDLARGLAATWAWRVGQEG